MTAVARRRATAKKTVSRRGSPSEPARPVLYAVRCRFCNRIVGMSSTDRSKGIICSDPLCSLFPPAGEHEARDAAIALVGLTGLIPATIATLFGITRQRVVQVIAASRGESKTSGS